MASGIDPETKKPTNKKEMLWRAMIPGEQAAYALKRGIKKGWKPPKGQIPIPPDQRSGELWDKWEAYMSGKSIETKSEDLAKSTFTLAQNSWMGQVVVRGIPKIEWYLRIKTPEGVREYYIPDGNPIHEQPLAAFSNGIVNKKWMTFEGKLPPRTTYNPNKKLYSHMSIADKGSVDVDYSDEKMSLVFHGNKLKGKWELIQEEAKSSTYTLQRLFEEKDSEEEELGNSFVLQKHYGDKINTHWDIRVSSGFEFNIYKDPLTIAVGSSAHAVKKNISDVKTLREKWMSIVKPHSFRLVGPLATYVDPIDRGSIEVIENTENFISMKFHGKKLSGYFVYKKANEGKGGQFEHSKLPQPLSDGSPKGSAYDPFKIVKKQGWNYYWIEIYDIREFTRCTDYKEYFPDLSKPEQIQEILVCLYQVPGEIHHARVSRVKVSDDWTVEQATSWIKENKLHTWDSVMKRKGEPAKPDKEEKSEPSDEELDETFKSVLEQIREQGKHKNEEKEKLDKELKKKKIELINAWLEAQKENK